MVFARPLALASLVVMLGAWGSSVVSIVRSSCVVVDDDDVLIVVAVIVADGVSVGMLMTPSTLVPLKQLLPWP